jgi:hypothetical protein
LAKERQKGGGAILEKSNILARKRVQGRSLSTSIRASTAPAAFTTGTTISDRVLPKVVK